MTLAPSILSSVRTGKAFLTAKAFKALAIWLCSFALMAPATALLSPAFAETATTTTLTTDANPSQFGSYVTLTATVSGNAPSGAVSFMDGATLLGTAPLSSGVASFATANLSVATHSITAVYDGDANNAVSTSSSLTQVVDKGNLSGFTQMKVGGIYVNERRLNIGTAFEFIVQTDPVATGAVTLKDGAVTIGSASIVPGTPTSISVNGLTVPGVHLIGIEYSGDANFNATVFSYIDVTVAPPPTSIAVATNPSTAAENTPLTVTATITGGVTPTGTMDFFSSIGGTIATEVPIINGVATATITTLTAGTHWLSVYYSGDENNDPNESAGITVTITAGLANTTTTLTSTANPASLGASVTLTASVTGATPSGLVTFKDGALTLGSGTVTNGVATLAISTLSIGTHTLTATYDGDTGNAASTSAALTQTINAALVGNPMTWQYGYDAMGRPTITTDPYGKSVYTYYDSLGRPIQTQQAVGSEQSIISLEYNAADGLTKVTDPRSLQTTYSPTGLGTVVSQTSPDTGTANATFDAKRNLTSRTDARGKVTTYSYDVLDRLSTIHYASGVDTTLEYDGGASPTPAAAGELTKFTDESGQTTYGYDSAGRLITKTQVTNGKTFVVSYTWGDTGSALDKLTSITYPSGNRVNYSYDAQGAVSGITVNTVNANGVGTSGTASPLLSGITWNAANAITGWVWASGKTQTLGYDQYGQMNSYKLGDPAGAGISAGSQRTLNYDGAGRIVGFSHTSNGVAYPVLDQTFAYDDLTRLISASLGSSAIQYSYDLNGNRTAKVISGTAYNNTVSPTSNKLTQTQDVGGTNTVQYDAAGNVTNDGVNAYTYSDRGRLSSVTTAGGVVNYRYNALELRTFKSGPSAMIPTGEAYYVYDETGKLLGEYDANNTPIYETIYLNASPVGVLKQSGTAAQSDIATMLHNVYADHLATPRVITRATDEAIVWRWDSAEAFGATMPEQNPNSIGTFAFNQRLPGQVFDAETGLFQNWHREYNARLGRYIQSDPIGLAGGINTFAYVNGNPLSFTDPTGLDPAGSAIGGAIGGWGGRIVGGALGTAVEPGGGTIVGAMAGGYIGKRFGSAVGGAIGDMCSPGAPDPCKGLRKQLADHEKKLADYKNNPLAADNRGLLTSALLGNDGAQAARVYDGRIAELYRQIEGWKREIKKCEERNGR